MLPVGIERGRQFAIWAWPVGEPGKCHFTVPHISSLKSETLTWFLYFFRLPGDSRDKQARAGDVLVGDQEKHHLFDTHEKKTHFGHNKEEFLTYLFIRPYFILPLPYNKDMFVNLFLLILSFTSWRSFLIGTRSTKHQKGFPGDWLASGVVLKVIEILRKNFDISFKIHNLLELSWENSCRKTISYKIWSKHNFNQEKNKCLWDGSLATGEFYWGVLRLGSFAQKAEE